MQRIGMVIRVRPEKRDEYIRLHAQVWPEVIAVIRSVGIRDFSIFHHADLLFGTFTFQGADLEAAFAEMNAQPVIQRWYQETEPCQQPVETAPDGAWWTFMDEVFHMP